ncbi:hypothetical protein [Aureivirga sp. CE67]|uniref:hypothetical protein n=1 Tax=Aureivirga sp. CE67 TaxID=1788983 RepID=UPI0018C921A1|nr:hypothetical protein [Aureivirga sp. CE67]
MKRTNLIELILITAAIGTAIGSGTIGMKTDKIVTKGRVIEGSGLNRYKGIENVANAIDTGFDGGAIGLGIISAACILGIVWIEITRIKLKE